MAPTKVKCFTWLVARRACLTHEVLRRKEPAKLVEEGVEKLSTNHVKMFYMAGC